MSFDVFKLKFKDKKKVTRLLDTSRSASANSRLITAMLAERPYQANSRSTSAVYTSYPTSAFTGSISGTLNMDRHNVSNEYKSVLYAANSNRSELDSRSPKGTALPTCVVNPSSTDAGYRSYDEDSYPPGYIPSRKQREFIPENKKDDGYWEKRRKNNEAARRSREKRRVHDMALENRIMELTRENCKVRNELILIKKKFGLSLDETFTGDETEPKRQEGPPPLHPVSETVRPSNPSLRVVSQENQARYPATLQQSPVRSRNISGTSSSPYMHAFPPYTTSSRQPSSQIITESYYMNHATTDPDIKPFSGNFDAQSPYKMKSTKDDSISSYVRVDDQVRPSYSSALPPNQISPYNSSLPVPYQKSYWLPTTDLTSSDSNDDYDWNDQDVQEQPLSLVKKRPSTENESSGELSNTSSRASNSPNSASSSLPLKLRHKVPNEHPVAAAHSDESSFSYQNGLTQLSEVALAHSNMSEMSVDNYKAHNINDSFDARPRSFSNPRSIYDNKYVERRRKNNEAARKCRENRKQLTKIREVKSGYLESENGKLKSELKDLQHEMRELRDLLEKKRQDKDETGELMINLDAVEDSSNEKQTENVNGVLDKKIKEEKGEREDMEEN
ncbi:nuclear factor interleukin-3-regulated protein-like isoform X2 [Mercenaria mercenaria]|uniref:nuclear factor interleukin-3-regulated protein-like isoform X2 n=1 Tax=Mercenaria mercenaria TaxID=6596 RepID=UPI00234E71D3|nr:nuclear factor interleukin-3-regulated protein-like isoform X2 [Mercenaria mercenaria]